MNANLSVLWNVPRCFYKLITSHISNLYSPTVHTCHISVQQLVWGEIEKDKKDEKIERLKKKCQTAKEPSTILYLTCIYWSSILLEYHIHFKLRLAIYNGTFTSLLQPSLFRIGNSLLNSIESIVLAITLIERFQDSCPCDDN